MKARVALVGCGAIARAFYVPGLRRLRRHVESVQFVDRDIAAAEEAARLWEGEALALPDARSAEVTHAIIATPPSTHLDLVRRFVSEGVTVLCEKPLVQDWRQYEDLQSATGAQLRRIHVNQTRRLFPSVQRTTELIKGRELGEIVSIEFWEEGRFRWPTRSGFYFNQSAAPRGVIEDRGGHWFDLLALWTGTTPAWTDVRTDSLGGPEARASLHGTCGAVKVRGSLSWLDGFRQPGWKVTLTDGEIHGELQAWTQLAWGCPPRVRRIGVMAPIAFNHFAIPLLRRFLLEDVPVASAADVAPSIAAIDQAYTRARPETGAWVEVLT